MNNYFIYNFVRINIKYKPKAMNTELGEINRSLVANDLHVLQKSL